jgi:hypothetical protein
MQLEQRVAQRVLDLRVAVQLDVRLRPNLVERRPLEHGEFLEAERASALEAAPDVGHQRGGVTAARPVIGEQLHQTHRLSRCSGARQRPARERPLGRRRVAKARRRGDHIVVHARRDDIAAAPRLMDHQGLASVLLDQAGHQRIRRQRGTRPRVGRPGSLPRSGVKLRVHGDLHRLLDRLELVLDRRELPMTERHQPPRPQPHLVAARRAPAQRPRQQPGAQVQHPLVRDDRAGPHVQRLTLDDKPDPRTVSHIHQHLVEVRIAEPAVGVRDRPRLEEAAQVGA